MRVTMHLPISHSVPTFIAQQTDVITNFCHRKGAFSYLKRINARWNKNYRSFFPRNYVINIIESCHKCCNDNLRLK